MRVVHPVALADDGVVDDYVDVDGGLVAVDDDGTFEAPEAWVEEFAARYGVDADAIVQETTETCDAELQEGGVCGRELPCPYHSDEED